MLARKRLGRNSFFLFLLLVVLACGFSFATTVDFKVVYFQAGLPKEGGDLSSSTVMFNDYTVPVLKANTSTFLSMKSNAKVKIVGFTDNKECRGEACKALSLRRAQLVNGWLLSNGFPADKLLAPEGHGSEQPAASNVKSEGRQQNRRVEFQVISSPGQH